MRKNNKRTSSKPRPVTRKRETKKNIRQQGTTSKDIVAGRRNKLFTVKLETKKAFQVTPDVDNSVYPKMYTDLLPAYVNYCKLVKETPKQLNFDSAVKNVVVMYNHMKDLIASQNKDAVLNIDSNYIDGEDPGNYHFVVHRSYFIGHEFYAIPLELFKHLTEEKSTIVKEALAFTRLLIEKVGFSDWTEEQCRLHYCVEMLPEHAEWYLSDNADEDKEVASSILDDYYKYTKGQAAEWLQKVRKSRRFNKKDLAALKRKRYKNTFVEFFRQWMISGYELLSCSGCKPVQSFQYKVNPDLTDEEHYEEQQNGYGLEIDNLFVVVWSDFDMVTENHTEGLNVDANEFGMYEPMEWHIIDETTTLPYIPSEWFPSLLKWLHQGLSHISKYNDFQRA